MRPRRSSARVARDAVLVVALDDLHWADSESLLLLAFLAREIRDARLLVVGTYREVEMRQAAAIPRILDELGRQAHVLRLAGLVPGDVASYVASSTGRAAAEDVVDAIHRATDGNAYYMTEVVRSSTPRAGWTGHRWSRSGSSCPTASASWCGVASSRCRRAPAAS